MSKKLTELAELAVTPSGDDLLYIVDVSDPDATASKKIKVSTIATPPGGTDTQLQYNNGGAFGGMSGSAWTDAARSLAISGATLTASAPILDLSQTWNNGAVTFVGMQFTATDTASSAASVLARWSTGASHQFAILKSGGVQLANASSIIYFGANYSIGGSGNDNILFSNSGTSYFCVDKYNFSCQIQAGGGYGWRSTGGADGGAYDLILRRDAANTHAWRNGTAAQTGRIYNTFTNASNGEWLNIGWASNVCTIGTRSNGTGDSNPRSLDIETASVTRLSISGTTGEVAALQSVILPKTTNIGIKVDTDTPTFGWRDILGQIEVRGSGGADPAFAVYTGTGMRQYQFSATTLQEVFIVFHIPHDYVPGTDIHFHMHWSNAAATPNTGNVRWGFDYSYAKGFNQEAFPAFQTVTVTQACPATRYQHMVAETAAVTIPTLEVDGIILVRAYRDAANAGDTCTDAVFAHTADVHYQSTNMATKAKAPSFYV